MSNAEQKRIFVCWRCGRTFATSQTEEEVLAEMRQRFGDVPEEEQESLCDDCEAEYMNRVVGGRLAPPPETRRSYTTEQEERWTGEEIFVEEDWRRLAAGLREANDELRKRVREPEEALVVARNESEEGLFRASPRPGGFWAAEYRSATTELWDTASRRFRSYDAALAHAKQVAMALIESEGNDD